MEAALAICLQKAQVDIVDAVQEKTAQAQLAAQAQAEAAQLRAVVEASGTENQRRIVALQDIVQENNRTVQIQDRAIEAMTGTIGAMEDINQAQERVMKLRWQLILDLNKDLDQLMDGAKLLKKMSDTHLNLWLDAVEEKRRLTEENDKLKRSERRSKMFLARARKSRNKAQRKVHRLQAKVRKA